MNSNNNHFHGSDLEKIEQKYQIPKDDILNFSGNVNPLGISPLLRTRLYEEIDCIATYPDRHYTSLRECLSTYCNIPSSHIIVGNGSTELISLVIKILHPKKTLILGPTYSEYEREISLGGGAASYYPLKAEADFILDVDPLITQLDTSVDLLVLCNPNNPTSTAIDQKTLQLILDHCKALDIFVMIDETYVEFAEQVETITAVPLTAHYSNLFIIRGISKFFSAPGLRLGYGICSHEGLVHTMNTRQNPWSINTLAALAGEVMFQDQDYILATRDLIHQERERIYKQLQTWPNLRVVPPTANFVLVELLDERLNSTVVFDTLIRERLMVRDCSTFPFLNDRYIRFCFLLPEHNDRLIQHLDRIVNDTGQ